VRRGCETVRCCAAVTTSATPCYIRYIRSIIPIVVQLKKSDAAGGRGVSEIYFADEVDEDGKRIHGRRG